MNGQAIPGAYLFRMYMCDKEKEEEEEEETYCTSNKL
jgi:hypothetical protein